MNYVLFGRYKDDKRFGAMNIAEGRVGVKQVFATLIPDFERAKGYADSFTSQCKDYTFQVREAATSKIVYTPEKKAA